MNRKEKALEFVDTGYNVQITGRHLQITDAMKDYALDKLSKIERFMDRIIDVNVIMDIQKLEHRVEIILKVGHFKITSQASSNDMYASIDKAVNKMEAQIRRYKNKITDHHAKSAEALEMNVNVIAAPVYEEEDFDEITPIDGFRPHQIVKQESRPLKLLTSDEAIMKMELSNDPFLIFKNEKDNKLNVIYRRKDGHYGIIEPSC